MLRNAEFVSILIENRKAIRPLVNITVKRVIRLGSSFFCTVQEAQVRNVNLTKRHFRTARIACFGQGQRVVHKTAGTNARSGSNGLHIAKKADKSIYKEGKNASKRKIKSAEVFSTKECQLADSETIRRKNAGIRHPEPRKRSVSSGMTGHFTQNIWSFGRK